MSCYQYQLVYGRAEVSAHTRRGWENRCVMDMPHQPRLMRRKLPTGAQPQLLEIRGWHR